MCSYCFLFIFFFKQKTAYEMRISDWSSDVCSSDLRPMKATFTTNLRSSISSDRRVTVITYNRAANGPKNRPFAPPDVPQPRPGNLEIRNCGDHQVETCQIGCGFGHDVENQRGRQYNLDSHRHVRHGDRKSGVRGKSVTVRVDHG